ncbi:MAG: hypothetical protein HOP31_07165 [Ignavibacteria bacterium]|nr:hypothetical protein [Ignavibacteria bacterium]
MKKTFFAAVLITAISLVYFTNTANAKKASFGFSISSPYSFNFTSMDGASSVCIEAATSGGMGTPYIVIHGLESLTSPGSYAKTNQQMIDQYGSGNFQARIRDNNNSSHVSQIEYFSIP